MVVGVEDLVYYPHYAVENGEYKGFGREVLDAFAKEKNYKLVYKPLPVNRLFISLFNGDIDFKYPDHPHWQVEQKKELKIVYSQVVVKTLEGIMLLPQNRGKNKLERVGTLLGFTPHQYLELEKEGKIKIYTNSSMSGLIQQVLTRRVDGVFLNVAVCEEMLRDLKLENALVFDDQQPFTYNDYCLSTIKYPQVMREFNEFLLQQKDLIEGLKLKYKIK